MDSIKNHIANLGTDTFTNPTGVQLHMKIKCHGFATTHIANLGTDMLTNPTVVRLLVKVHGFHNDSHRKP